MWDFYKLIFGTVFLINFRSYLVCSMYEEAATLASSIVRQLKGSNISDNNEAFDENELFDMLESAGMVFVQALNQLGR